MTRKCKSPRCSNDVPKNRRQAEYCSEQCAFPPDGYSDGTNKRSKPVKGGTVAISPDGAATYLPAARKPVSKRALRNRALNTPALQAELSAIANTLNIRAEAHKGLPCNLNGIKGAAARFDTVSRIVNLCDEPDRSWYLDRIAKAARQDDRRDAQREKAHKQTLESAVLQGIIR